MPDRRSLRKQAVGKARDVAGTLGEGASKIAERAREAKRKRQQVTDQEKARLQRARAKAQKEAEEAARQEFVEEYREEIKEAAKEEQKMAMRRRAGLESDDNGGGSGGGGGRRRGRGLPVFSVQRDDGLNAPSGPEQPRIGPGTAPDERDDDGGGPMLGPNEFEPYGLAGFEDD